MSIGRATGFIFLLAILVIAVTSPALAICPMCKANLANAENAKELSRTVNTAILVLLVPTLLIIGGLVKLVFHYGRTEADEIAETFHESLSPPNNSYVNLRSSDSQRNPE